MFYRRKRHAHVRGEDVKLGGNLKSESGWYGIVRQVRNC